ncbi:MAG: hypothetical protein ABIH83_02685 [Candidatus Micrarchaeota archaeon]
MAEKDQSKIIIAAILNLILPGAGHWFIGSRRAGSYFLGFVLIFIVTMVIAFGSFGMCFPIYFLPLIYTIISMMDVYYEASGENKRRILKEYIK